MGLSKKFVGFGLIIAILVGAGATYFPPEVLSNSFLRSVIFKKSILFVKAYLLGRSTSCDKESEYLIAFNL